MQHDISLKSTKNANLYPNESPSSYLTESHERDALMGKELGMERKQNQINKRVQLLITAN
jgi:hypothetical protein